jgi:hypothetical protein
MPRIFSYGFSPFLPDAPRVSSVPSIYSVALSIKLYNGHEGDDQTGGCDMNPKRYAGAAAAVVGIQFVLDFIVHGVLLKDSYQATASLWRPMAEMQGLMWTMWVLYLLCGLVLPYLYSKGYEPGKGVIGQGLRFGVAIGLLLASGMSLGTYFMIPLPRSMAVAWFVAGMVQYAVIGMAIALIHRPKTVS